MSEEMSGSTPVEMSAEEIRLRERRSFEAFNEAQAKSRQINRDYSAKRDAAEKERWARSEVDADGTGEMAENDSLGG